MPYGHYLISCLEQLSEIDSIIITLTLQMRKLKSKIIIEIAHVTKLLHLITELINLISIPCHMLSSPFLHCPSCLPIPIFSGKPVERHFTSLDIFPHL